MNQTRNLQLKCWRNQRYLGEETHKTAPQAEIGEATGVVASAKAAITVATEAVLGSAQFLRGSESIARIHANTRSASVKKVLLISFLAVTMVEKIVSIIFALRVNTQGAPLAAVEAISEFAVQQKHLGDVAMAFVATLITRVVVLVAVVLVLALTYRMTEESGIHSLVAEASSKKIRDARYSVADSVVSASNTCGAICKRAPSHICGLLSKIGHMSKNISERSIEVCISLVRHFGVLTGKAVGDGFASMKRNFSVEPMRMPLIRVALHPSPLTTTKKQ